MRKTLLEENFRAYINGFSKNVDDIIEYFNYRATIGVMVKNFAAFPPIKEQKTIGEYLDTKNKKLKRSKKR